MLRPILDYKCNVLIRGVSGRYDTVAPGKYGVRCHFGVAPRSPRNAAQSTSASQAEPTAEYMLMWNPDVVIDPHARLRLTQRRKAGQWVALTDQPLYVLIEASDAAPEVRGYASHRQGYIARFDFPHYFTRTPIVATGVDAENNPKRGPGTPEPNLPCRYFHEELAVEDTGGRTTVLRPQLALPYDSALAYGDLVSSVVDDAGAELQAGPLRVASVVSVADSGTTTSKRASLHGADARL